MTPLFSILLATTVCLLLQFPNMVRIEARKLASNSGFSVDLIHRYSPLSPSFNSSLTPRKQLRKPIFGCVSHHHNIRLSSEFYDSKDFQTDIIPNGGDYLMKIAFGTPPVEFTASVDTGSDLVWLQCSPCQQCIPQKSPLFDPTKSSTYKTISCNSQTCNLNDVPSGCLSNASSNNESCTYVAQYGDGSSSIGTLDTDTITFPSATIHSFIFGCGYNQQGNLGIDGDGIVGLGGGALSLVSQLSSTINKKFSYCLTPFSSGVNSKLSFGEDVISPGAVSTPYTTQKDNPTFYYLTLDSITIGKSSVPVANNVIIDSGTTLTYLPSSVYDSIRSALKGAIELDPVADPNRLYDPCYKAQKEFSSPDLLFTFKGADVVLKTVNTFITLDDLTCFATLPTDDTFIFGNVAQINFHVGYDLQAQKVYFAPTDCTKE